MDIQFCICTPGQSVSCVEVLDDWALPTVVQKGDKVRMFKLVICICQALIVQVDLRCNYKLEGENMYSLKWYRDDVEFYRSYLYIDHL